MLRISPAINTICGVVPSITRSHSSSRLVAATREQEPQLADLSLQQLRERSDSTRELINREGPDSLQAKVNAFAIASEALWRANGIRLYDVQMAASAALARGAIAEMQTGEGKTFSCAPAACLHALTGRGVHVANPNQYLATRDCEMLQPAFRLLGISVGLLPEQTASNAEKRSAYQCDITYGTSYEFGFDYLRDQLTLQEASRREPGSALLASLAGESSTSGQLIQRGLYYSIVDEADHVLLDDAVSPMLLSAGMQGEAIDADVHRAARDLAADLESGVDYRVSSATARVELTDTGIDRIHSLADKIPIDMLQRTWTEYIEQALRVVALRRDVHYVVSEDDEIQIVDSGTGRIFTDRTWSEGLHQAIEAKEHVPITPDKKALAQITRQRFSRMYERLAGMTGTAVGCEREFQQVYSLSVEPIPLRTPSQRALWPTRFFVDQDRKWQAIASSVQEIHQQQRPVLIGTSCIADSELLALLLRERGVDFQLLNGRQDADEAAIVAEAGRQSAVTIATSLAGRGTDIKLAPQAKQLGGLHVILAEHSDSTRVDRQLIGRCARQGDPGSAQVFVSAEDPLIQRYGGWLVRSLERHAAPNGEVHIDFRRQLFRIQRSAERSAYASRCGMLRRDLSRDSLFSRKLLDC